jgi:hypothetical protein
MLTIQVLQLKECRAGCILVVMEFIGPETSEEAEFSRTLAPSDLAECAAALVKSYPECFWFWRPDARIRTLADVRLVVEHLRQYGGRHAWQAAQELHRCLLPLFRRKS